MKRRFVLLWAVGLAALLALGGGVAGAAKIKIGHVAPPFHGQNKGVEAFAAYIKEKTGGRIDIANFPMGQLGGERSLAEQVQAGTLQLASVSTAVLQNFVPETAVIDLPFLWPNRATAYAVLDDPEFQAKLFSYLPKKGFIGIGWTENEMRDFTNNKRPVHTPDDIKGLKVRVMNSPVYMDTFKQLGASVVGIPFPEIYNALQTGVIDAQENPLMTSILMKFTEVTKYATLTQHCLTECAIIASPDYWDTLSKADQQIFLDAAKMSIKVNREVNAALDRKLPKSGLSVTAYSKKAGIEVVTLTEAEREKFRQAVVPVWDKYKGMFDPGLLEFTLDKIKQHRK